MDLMTLPYRIWSRIFSPPTKMVAEPSETGGEEWNPHGLPTYSVVKLQDLNNRNRYKISEIVFFDRFWWINLAGPDDFFSDAVSLRPCGVYTRAQLLTEVETLDSSGFVKEVDIQGKANADGTLSLTISFTENTWDSANAFRCVNVGRRGGAGLLPEPVRREVEQMLRREKKVSPRMLGRIRCRVEKWYHDEGYACSQVVNFQNLNSRELVCEVVEGDITEVTIKFKDDDLGNVCDKSSHLAVVRCQLPEQLQEGHAFNIEAGKEALRNIMSLVLFSRIEIMVSHLNGTMGSQYQVVYYAELQEGHVFNIEAVKEALRNIISLALFSDVEVIPRLDERNEGGIIVEIYLGELEQKSAEASTERSLYLGIKDDKPSHQFDPLGLVHLSKASTNP